MKNGIVIKGIVLLLMQKDYSSEPWFIPGTQFTYGQSTTIYGIYVCIRVIIWLHNIETFFINQFVFLHFKAVPTLDD
jgi:hypothetical protein